MTGNAQRPGTVVDGQAAVTKKRGREKDRETGERMKRTRERSEVTEKREREREVPRVRRDRWNETKNEKKKISPRGGRGDWHSRLVKLRWPRMENEVFDHARKGMRRGGEEEKGRKHLLGTVGQFKRKIQKVN